MAITYPLTIPSAPGFSGVEWIPSSTIAGSLDPFTFQPSAYDWGGQVRSIRLELPHMSIANAKAWQAFFCKLNGETGTFYFSDTVGAAGLGTVAGTPRVNGVGQDGPVLITDGWTSGDTVKAGDWISINDRLYTVVTDAVESSGSMTITLWPDVTGCIADDAAISYGAAARGIFRLEEFPSYAWDVSRLQAGISFTATEEIADSDDYTPPLSVDFDLTGLQAWWDLDSVSFIDSHSNGYDLSVVGSVAIDRCGGPDFSPVAVLPGNVIGSNYLTRAIHESWNEMSGNFTVIAWVYSTQSAYDGYHRSIIGNGDAPTTLSYGWNMSRSSVAWVEWHKPAYSGIYTSGVDALYSGTWNMVAMRWDGFYAYLRVNKTNSAFDPLVDGGAFTHGADPLNIGGSPSIPFAGKVQRVSIWQRTLSIDELDVIYNGGLGRPYSSLNPI
jgi:hypothetical protein